jgi:hypothetical protein
MFVKHYFKTFFHNPNSVKYYLQTLLFLFDQEPSHFFSYRRKEAKDSRQFRNAVASQSFLSVTAGRPLRGPTKIIDFSYLILARPRE